MDVKDKIHAPQLGVLELMHGIRKLDLPSGYLTVCHGKSHFLIGKPSINGPFSMAMLNNQRVHDMIHGIC